MMAELIGLISLGMTLIFTQYLTARSTQKIVTEILRLQKETHELQKSMILCLRKIDLGMRANAKMHGWVRLDNVSPEEAAKLPEPKKYDPELRVCYFKPN